MRSLNSASIYTIGVDVGGTKVAAILVDADNTVLARHSAPTNLHSVEETLEGIAQVVETTMQQAKVDRSLVHAIGLGVPGHVEPSNGIVRLAVNLNWQEVAVGAWLTNRLDISCYLENDVRTGALGVYAFACPDGARSLIYLSIGTGVAAGIILNGELYRGSNGMAGEIGHTVIDPQGIRCKCGAYGCIEALVAGPAIATAAQTALIHTSGSLLHHHTPLTAADVYAAAATGDALAQRLVANTSHYLALALRQIALSYDTDHIVIGGGVTAAGAAFSGPLTQAIEELRRESPLAQMMLNPARISISPVHFNAGTWGAIALARRSAPAHLFASLHRQESDAVPLSIINL